MKISGGNCPSQMRRGIPGFKTQTLSKSQNATIKSIALCSFGISLVEICLGSGFWDLGFLPSSVCCFFDQFPTCSQMFFGREHVAQADPHYCSAAQFCLREIGPSGSVDSLYDVGVQLVEFLLIRIDEPKADHAHAGSCGQLEMVVLFDPVGEQVYQMNLFAQASNNSGPA